MSNKKIDDSKLIQLIDDHKSYKIIAKELGVSVSTLHEYCKNHGFKTKPLLVVKIIKEKHAPRYVPPTKEEINKWLQIDGLSMSEIARKLNKNVAYISRLCKRYNISSNFNSDKIDVDIQQLCELYVGQKKSMYEISKIMNRSPAILKEKLLSFDNSIHIRNMNEAKRPAALDDKNLLLQFSTDKLSLRSIAKHFGVNKRTVRAAYRRHGMSFYMAPSHIFIKDDIENLYYNENMTIEQIADFFGISIGYMSFRFKSLGIDIKDNISKHPEFKNADYLQENYIKNGLSANEIAINLKSTVGNVVHFLQKFNIPIRPKDEVYKKLFEQNENGGTGKKVTLNTRFGVFKCDSQLEAEYLTDLEMSDYNGSIEKNFMLSDHGSSYFADFKLDDKLVEIKPKNKIVVPGVERKRLIKQHIIAKNCGYDLNVWCDKKYHKIEKLEDDDIYYCLNWRLVFSTVNDCFEWLLNYGFKPPKWSSEELYSGLYEWLDIKAEDALNANFPSSKTLNLLKNFYWHYWFSSRINCKTIGSAWETENSPLLLEALSTLWGDNRRNPNIYNLLNYINRTYQSYSTVSIFKPWVARHIYETYLPDGGTIVDPCIGWGGRLLACMGKYEYIGYDLNKNSIQSSKDLVEFTKNKISCKLSCADSSLIDFEKGDLLFTSPPYDNTELYYGIDSLKTVTDPIYGNIFKKFNGIIALNVPQRHEELCISIASKYGKTLIGKKEMKTSSIIGRKKTSEPILVFN